MLCFTRSVSVLGIAVFACCSTAANAAANTEVLGQSDNSIYGAIGLAPVVSFNCIGVNAGVWMIDKYTNYLGTITVSASSNAALAPTTVVTTSLTQAKSIYSVPAAGICRLSGVINPTTIDYRLTLSSHQDIAFVPGKATNVMNVANQLPPATIGLFGSGLWGTFTLASDTPHLELDGTLVWRLGIVVSVNGFRTTGFNTFYDGGYITGSPASATVGSAPTNSPP